MDKVCSFLWQVKNMRSITVSSIDDCIDKVLAAGVNNDEQWRNDLNEKGFRLQRASTPREWKSLLEFVAGPSGETSGAPLVTDKVLPSPIPHFYGIGLYSLHGAQLCGVVTFYVAYSSWDGRYLFIDQLDFPGHAREDTEKNMLRPLAKIAVELDCARLTWRVSTTSYSCQSVHHAAGYGDELTHGFPSLSSP